MSELYDFWRDANRRDAANALGLTWHQYIGRYGGREDMQREADRLGLTYAQYLDAYQPEISKRSLEAEEFYRYLVDVGDGPARDGYADYCREVGVAPRGPL